MERVVDAAANDRDRLVVAVLRATARGLMAKPGVAGADDGFGAVRHLELAKDVRDVVADRLRAEHQTLGNGCVVPTLGDIAENLPFAGAQLRELRCGGARLAEERDQSPRDVRPE